MAGEQLESEHFGVCPCGSQYCELGNKLCHECAVVGDSIGDVVECCFDDFAVDLPISDTVGCTKGVWVDNVEALTLKMGFKELCFPCHPHLCCWWLAFPFTSCLNLVKGGKEM